MRALCLILCFFSSLSTWGQDTSEPPFLYTYSNENVPINDEGDEQTFPINVDLSGVEEPNYTIAKVTAYVDIEHPNPEELEVVLEKPNSSNSIVLHSPGDEGIPTGNQGINAVYDSLHQPSQGTLQSFAGWTPPGEWTLYITDHKRGNRGLLKSWAIEIEPAHLARFDIQSPTYELKVWTDGYGSFGDKKDGSNMGAKFRPRSNLDNPHRTVFHSSLFFLPNKLFLNSIDMYPGERLSWINIDPIKNNVYKSHFQLDDYDVTLTQSLIEHATHAFSLKQEYFFNPTNFIQDPPTLIRYFNPMITLPHDPEGLNLHLGTRQEKEDEPPFLYVFGKIENSTAEKVSYVGIGFKSESVESWDYTSNVFREANSKRRDFPSKLYHLGEKIFDSSRLPFMNNDNDGDGVTDPGKGFDAALALSTKINTNRAFRYTAITHWGYASPSEVLYVTPTSTPTPIASPTAVATATPTPTLSPTWTPTSTMTYTPTPVPTSTFTPPPRPTNTFTPTHTFTSTPSPTSTLTQTPTRTPTPTPPPTATPLPSPSPTNTEAPTPTPQTAAPAFIHKLPDIKLLLGENSRRILNLSDYIHVEDNSVSDLNWRISSSNNLPLYIEDNHWLSCRAIHTPGDYGELTITVSDGVHSASQTIQLRVSSFLLKSFYAMPPLTQTAEPNTFTSPYRLNDMVVRSPSLPEEDSSLVIQWQTASLPPGVEQVTIHPDTSFTVVTEDHLEADDLFIPLIAQRVHVTPTITPTSTMTPIPTPTYTFTPTPTPSPRPTSVASPTPTPPHHCAEAFHFGGIQIQETLLGPIDGIMRRTQEGVEWLISHYDEGVVLSYAWDSGQWTEKARYEMEYGIANIALGDANGDALDDLFVINPVEQSLSLWLSEENRPYARRVDLSLPNQAWVDIYGIQGVHYQSLALVDLNQDGRMQAALRFADAILIVTYEDGQLVPQQHLNIDGSIHFIKSADLNRDGSPELILGLQSDDREQVRVYSGTAQLEQFQSIYTDDLFEGNSPLDVLVHDWDGDRNLDLGIVLFDGRVSLFRSTEEGEFTQYRMIDSIPLGIMDGYAFEDLNDDGRLEIAILQRSQEGVQLHIRCGSHNLDYTETLDLELDENPSINDQLLLTLFDHDGDGDKDIHIMRYMQDSLWTLENLATP